MVDETQMGFKITFDGTSSPKTIVLEDISNIPGIGDAVTVASYAARLIGKMPDGSIFTNNATDIDPDGVGSLAVFNLPLDANGNFKKGLYTFTYEIRTTGTSGNVVTTIEKTYNYQHNTPTTDIEMSYDVYYSTLTATDATVYPGTFTRVSNDWIVKWPEFLPVIKADVIGTLESVTIPANIYTGVYAASYEGVVLYPFDNEFYIREGYSSVDTIKVVGNSLLCQIRCVLESYTSDIKSAIDSGMASVKLELTVASNYLLVSYKAYEAAIACGDSAKAVSIKEGILAFIAECGCECEDCDEGDDDGVPKEILPIGSAVNTVGTASDFEFLFGSAQTPDNTLGVDGNVYFSTTTSDFYKKIGGSWVLQDNLQGASAYEVAVANGFVGTAAEWLASLEGEDATPYFTYIAYADSFDGTGAPVGFSQTKTATSRYISKLETTTEITTFNAASQALFASNWVQFDAIIAAGSPIDVAGYTGTDPVILQDDSRYVESGGLYLVNLRLVVEFVANRPTFTLPLNITHDSSIMNSVWGIDRLTQGAVRIRSNLDTSLNFFYTTGTDFLATNTYEIEAQLILVKK